MNRRVALMLFEGFQLQGLAGPLSAFEVANRFRPNSYSLVPVPTRCGPVTSSVGISMASCEPATGPFDTILMPGGGGLEDPATLQALLGWLSIEAPRARRLAAICTGAYLAAEAGLLDGLRATTHWQAAPHFGQRYPRVRLQPDEIVVRDGAVWTSAGISAGIDLALALIADDLGPDISQRVARQLVVPYRRAGGQLQFSSLRDQGYFDGRFASLFEWMHDHMSEKLDVEALADRMAMSPRNFARVFTAETGMTPAKAVERMRIERARSLLETSRIRIEKIAESTGFRDPERMRRAFLRTFGMSPQAMRRIDPAG